MSTKPDLHHDEFDRQLAESMKDPEFAAAFHDSGVRHAVIDALLARRKELGLTQTEVGERMGGVGQPTISEFESEPSDPRLSTLQRYARAVNAKIVCHAVLVEPIEGVDRATFDWTSLEWHERCKWPHPRIAGVGCYHRAGHEGNHKGAWGHSWATPPCTHTHTRPVAADDARPLCVSCLQIIE